MDLGADLGLDNYPDCLRFVGRVVQVHGADPVCMTHDGYSRAVLNTLYKLVTASRHHEIDIPVLGQERRDFVSCRDRLDKGVWDLRSGEGVRDEGR